MDIERLKDYINTLQAVEVHLPATAHSDHRQRLKEMQSYFKRLIKAQEEDPLAMDPKYPRIVYTG